MARTVTIECSILVKQIAFGNEAAVDIAPFEIDGGLALVLDMRYFFAGSLTEFALEDQ